MKLRFPTEILFCVTISGATIKDANKWSQYIEDQIRGDRSKSEISMHIKAETWDRTLEIRADVEGDDKALVFIDAPAKEKGIGTLRLQNNMWNWFPKLKRKVIVSPSMLLSAWMGSDFTNDDLLKASNMSKDYQHAFTGEEGEYQVITNTAKSDAKVMWPKVVTLASKKDCMPYFHRYYDKQGKLVRVMGLSKYGVTEGHNVPMQMEMIPQDGKGKKTVMTYKSIKFKTNFAANHFSMQNLTEE